MFMSVIESCGIIIARILPPDTRNVDKPDRNPFLLAYYVFSVHTYVSINRFLQFLAFYALFVYQCRY